MLVIHHLNGEPWILRWERRLGSSVLTTNHGAAYVCIGITANGWQWAIWSPINELLHRGQHECYDQAIEAILRFLATINADRVAVGVEQPMKEVSYAHTDDLSPDDRRHP